MRSPAREVDQDPEHIAARWAALPYPILIRGERGTGKTDLARRIHGLSGRQGRFVNGSLATMAKGIELAELLGSVKGAFTGAVAREGVFARAHQGTAFLDEIGRASLEAQSGMLGVLDHERLTPLGASCEITLDVRIIAATNGDLESMVAAGSFLADLLDRFGYYLLCLKPLRERREEILPILNRRLARESHAIGRPEPPVPSRTVEKLLLTAPWRGNIRDLVKLAEYLAGTAPRQVEVADLPPAFLATVAIQPQVSELPLAVRARRMIEACEGNISEAARRLGKSRGHLHRLLKSPSETPTHQDLAAF